MRIIACVLSLILVFTVIILQEQDMDVVKAYNTGNLIKVKAVTGCGSESEAGGTVSTTYESKNTKWEI